MNEFLHTLLQAVIVAAVPVITGGIIKGISALVKYFSVKTDNDTAKKYLAAAEEAARRAVTYVSQTYVDALKKSDKFTKENQEEALNRAVEKATNLLTHEAVLFLEGAYGDLTEFLKTYIEAEVRGQKQQNSTMKPGEPFTAELKEAAAATAAATAAAVAQAAISKEVPDGYSDAIRRGAEIPHPC